MRHLRPPALVSLWLFTRAAPLLLLLIPALHEHDSDYDVRYYAERIHDLLHGGSLLHTMPEYPLPALLVTTPQYLLSAGSQAAYLVVFPASIILLDGVLCLVLWRAAGRRMSLALAFWLAFLPLLAPMAYFRFDLVPAVLTVVAAIVLLRRPAVSGALIAAGAALKIWPAIAVVAAMALPRGRRRVFGSFVAVGGGLTLACLAIAGASRLTTPLDWQFDRGLQIESGPATPLLIWRLWHEGSYATRLSDYQAYEIFGPGVHVMLAVSSGLVVAAVLVLALLWFRTWHRPSTEAAAWLLLTAATLQTVTNKVLSPQYLIWIGGTALVVLACSPSAGRRRPVVLALLGAAALSHLTFPIMYGHLVHDRHRLAVVTTVLALRNALLVYLGGLAAIRTWRLTRAAAEC